MGQRSTSWRAIGSMIMQKLSIRQVLGLLFIVPVLCVTLSIWQLAPVATGRMHDAKALDRSVQLGAVAGDLVHALQVERGSSAGLLAATEGRTAHRNRMLAAQEASDKTFETFTAAFEAAKAEGMLSERAAKFTDAIRKLADDIKATREKIITSNIELPELIGFYSGAINDLIQGSAAQGAAGANETVADLRVALRSLLFAKERAGLQRATGNAMIASEKIEDTLLEAFIIHTGAQEQFLDQVRYALGDGGKTFIDKRITAEAATAHQTAERGLIDAAREGKPVPTSGEDWWNMTTIRINALKALETDIAAQLHKLSEQESARAQSDLISMIASQALAIALGLGATAWIGIGLSTPIRRASDALERSLRGEADVVPPPPMPESSEIGRISNAVGRFIEASAERQKLMEEREATNARLGEDRRQILRQMEQEFNDAAGAATGTLQMAAATLNEKSIAMLSTVNAVRIAQDEAHAAAETSRGSAEEVTRLSDELSRSISEIAEQTARTATLTQEVLGRADNSRESAGKFEEVANAIGSIVDLINAIASQTNLLALNATIEAARAGAAGRGFAVVAGEVKELASRTMEATRTIESKVSELKIIARQAAGQAGALTDDVGTIQGLNAAIAAAVHQQHMTSEGFGQSIHALADAVRAVGEQVDSIAKLGSDAHVSAESVQGVADEMERTTGTLVETLPRIIAETSKRIAG